MLYNETLDTFMILEAKGSNQAKRLGKLSRGQFSHSWIDSRLSDLIRRNRRLGGTAGEDAVALELAVRNNRPMLASVVSLNVRAGKIRFGLQAYQDLNESAFRKWRGF